MGIDPVPPHVAAALVRDAWEKLTLTERFILAWLGYPFAIKLPAEVPAR